MGHASQPLGEAVRRGGCCRALPEAEQGDLHLRLQQGAPAAQPEVAGAEGGAEGGADGRGAGVVVAAAGEGEEGEGGEGEGEALEEEREEEGAVEVEGGVEAKA